MKRTMYRDAATGEFVTEEYARANPGTTIADEVDTTDGGVMPLKITRERLESMTVLELARSFNLTGGLLMLYEGPENTEIVIGEPGLHEMVIAMMGLLGEYDVQGPPGPTRS